MKADIHPDYVECRVTCGCGNSFTTRATIPEMAVEVCSKCHPFYTGQQRFVDTAGRVEKFQKKFKWDARQAVKDADEARKKVQAKRRPPAPKKKAAEAKAKSKPAAKPPAKAETKEKPAESSKPAKAEAEAKPAQKAHETKPEPEAKTESKPRKKPAKKPAEGEAKATGKSKEKGSLDKADTKAGEAE